MRADQASDIKVLKEKKGVPTVIEWQGRRYQLQHPSQIKRGQSEKKPVEEKEPFGLDGIFL
ncbi:MULTISPECIES: hypothetical protein [unclassified Sutcliffiella]|uniref:hypothetical protein n=1 Tax=unclassified Sutcliffiella TaxID=2837532 RepID=UPI0030D3B22B